MRNAFCQSLVAQAARPEFVFLTGDLGYKALEPLREALGERFINAGVAEQNMVSVAAGLARRQLRSWTYSIAPFMYARPFEQIRNDVCLHNLPVVLVGNGGGYGYGVMGASHHAIEDYGSILTLPFVHAYVPAFDADVPQVIEHLFAIQHPAYLRLGLSEEPKSFIVPAFAPWRKLISGNGPTLIAVGPLAGTFIAPLSELPESIRPNFWVLSELPQTSIPDALLREIHASDHLIVVEEHVAHGGAGEMLARLLLTQGNAPKKMTHRHASGYPSGLYGSQKFHRAECGLDPASVLALFQ